MPGPWFLLLVFVQAGNLMTQSLTDAWLEREVEEDSPTCEELRSLWNSISRSVKTSELTNEIPLMPWDVFPNSPQRLHHHKFGKETRKHPQPKTSHSFLDTFGEDGPPSVHTIPALEPLLAPSPHPQNNAPIHGHFGDFGDPPRLENIQGGIFLNSPSTLPGTRKKGGSETMQSESSWGLPEEVGLFGRFLDLDGDFPIMTPRDRQEWSAAESSHFGSPSLDVAQETCLQILNRHCTVNEQCACIGWNTLKCIRGKCNSLQLKTEKENEHGSWHHGPLPRSKLGRQKRLRRSNTYTFM